MNSIWVFGGANIDVIGASVNDLIEYDSNIGNIQLSFGGVGRNIAEACCKMGSKVNFVTCFSKDHYGRLLKEDCEVLGMNCSYSRISENYPTSMYLAILEKDGDMRIAMSDMRILTEMDSHMIETALKDVEFGDFVVIDSNMTEEHLRFINSYISHRNSDIDREHNGAEPGESPSKIRIASDPVSINKIHRLMPVLNSLSVFKPNKIEAEALTGIEIKDEESAKENLRWFLDKGTEEIIITMADKGALLGYKSFYDSTNYELSWFRHRSIFMDNANGGGDAFMGAYLSQRARNVSPKEALKFAITTAIITIETETKGRRSINRELVLDRISDSKIIETVL